MAGRLDGKVAIVTGAGRGVGRAEAIALAGAGAAVVVNDNGCETNGIGSDSAPADEVVTTINADGGKAIANYGDISVSADAEALVKQALDEFGRLDIAVCNAGILRDRMVFNMTEEEWDAVIRVHLKGHFNVIKLVCLIFRQQRSGRIICTSSESGLGNMGQANYSAAKEGIIGLVRTTARDMGKYGVTCNAIRPRAGTRMTMSPEMQEAARRATGAGLSAGASSGMPHTGPEQIAPFVVYLAADAAPEVTGYDFCVYGDRISLMSQPQEIKTIYAPHGTWTIEEIVQKFPTTIGKELKAPAPLLGG